MKKTPFKMNPGFDALPGKVQAKIKVLAWERCK